MPDLTDPNIFPALIGVGGVVFTVIANMIFNLLYRKFDFNDKYFFEAYNRRLAVYEDVIKELGALGKPAEDLVQMSPGDFSTKLMQAVHTLNGLLVRLDLYGSPGSREDIKLLYVKLCRMIASEPPANLLGKKADAGTFLADVEQARIDFTDFVAGETGKHFVDKKIVKIAKKFMKIAKRMTRQNNSTDKALSSTATATVKV
jgi:hypothetical protein